MMFGQAEPGSRIKLDPNKPDLYLVVIEVDEEEEEVDRKLVHLASGILLPPPPFDATVYQEVP